MPRHDDAVWPEHGHDGAERLQRRGELGIELAEPAAIARGTSPSIPRAAIPAMALRRDMGLQQIEFSPRKATLPVP